MSEAAEAVKRGLKALEANDPEGLERLRITQEIIERERDFWRRLELLRQRRGLSIREVTRIAGFSVNSKAWYKWEADECKPTMRGINRIIEGLDLHAHELWWLITGEDA